LHVHLPDHVEPTQELVVCRSNSSIILASSECGGSEQAESPEGGAFKREQHQLAVSGKSQVHLDTLNF
jgi:hypothetical protein